MTKEQLEEDVNFLAKRANGSSSVSFGGYRDTGMSSNSIVGIAYGVTDLHYQCLPSDIGDMKSCENMWLKLPAHRKSGDAEKAMENARNCDYYGKVV